MHTLEQRRVYSAKHYSHFRTAALMLLGGQCTTCRFNDMRALNIDHVFGNGRQDRKHDSGHTFLQRVIREWASGKFQLLCANCNQIKRIENYEHKKAG